MPPTTAEEPKVDAPVADAPSPDTPTGDTSNASGTDAGADGASPLLTTSSSSRANYSDNVNTMNENVANLSTGAPQNYNYVDATGKVQTVSASSPEEAMSKATNIDPKSGVISPTIDPTKTDAGGGGTGGAKTDAPKAGEPDANGDVDNGDGTITTRDGAKIDSSLKSLYDNSITLLDQGIATAKSNLQQASATLKNNPAAQAAIAAIQAKFDEQIGLMKDKNRQLMGGNITNAARGGSLQYANEMTGNFLSDEQDRAVKRITDLQTQEADLILKTQESYKKGDVASFDAASKALDKANSDKLKAISDLLKKTDAVVKEKAAAQKADQAAAKQQVSDDIRLSTSLAAGVASQLAAAGIKDDEKKKKFIQDMATKAGIKNADIFASAVSKASLSAANTQSIIDKRGASGSGGSSTKGGGTDGSFTYTGDDVSLYTSLLNKGGTSPDGTKYNGRGSDGYVDPGAYTAAYSDWVAQGGTPAGFAKKFPVKSNVNPDGYDDIPAALRPTTKTSGGSPA